MDAIRWIGPKHLSNGMADANIADVRVANLPETTLEAVIWESDELSGGPHTMTRKLKGYGNASSSGNVVVLDRFEVDEIGRVWRHNKRVRF